MNQDLIKIALTLHKKYHKASSLFNVLAFNIN